MLSFLLLLCLFFISLFYAITGVMPWNFTYNYYLPHHLKRQKEFSLKTFGPDARLDGVLDHIKQELNEVKENPKDIYEWIDIALLAFDGAWRQGFTPDDISKALMKKLEKNEKREWPDWRTQPVDKAIKHVE